MPWDVFISYATSDGLPIANAVKVLFERRGINAFLADRDIEVGEPLGIRIRDALEQCNSLIAIFTKGAAKSGWVYNEISLAHEIKKSIFICKEESANRTHLPIVVQHLKRINFGSTEELISEIEKRLSLFVDAVRKIEYPILREGINKIPRIHELYEIAKRYGFLTEEFTRDENLHRLSKSIKIALAMESEENRSVSIPLSLIYSTLRGILEDWINKEEVELPRRYEDAERETGKALDILTVGVLKMLVDKNFISEMEVPL